MGKNPGQRQNNEGGESGEEKDAVVSAFPFAASVQNVCRFHEY
jgi:hypothetical protein